MPLRRALNLRGTELQCPSAKHLKVVKEIEDNRFRIRTSAPDVKVSWLVTGIRKDAWANAHRIIVEEDKAPAERGKFISPAEFGQPREMGLHYQPIKSAAPDDVVAKQ